MAAVFDVGSNKNLLFGSGGMLSRTLEYWAELLDDAFKLIESLRAELFKSRAETQKALGEKEKAESERIHSTLKLDQTRAELDAAQKALDVVAKVRRERAVQDAFDSAENAGVMRRARKEVHAKLLSLSPGRTTMARLKARRTPLHPTGLTWSPSRVVN